MDSSFKW
jgi:hypothetical protein